MIFNLVGKESQITFDFDIHNEKIKEILNETTE